MATFVQLFTGFNQHLAVVNWSRLVESYQELALGLHNGIRDIICSVSGVQRDNASTYLRNCVHEMQPFRAIGHPDRDVIPRFDAYRNKAFRHFVDIGCELTMCPTFSFKNECEVVFP